MTHINEMVKVLHKLDNAVHAAYLPMSMCARGPLQYVHSKFQKVQESVVVESVPSGETVPQVIDRPGPTVEQVRMPPCSTSKDLTDATM